MIHEVAPLTFHNEYRCCIPREDSAIMFFSGQELLVHFKSGAISYPTYSEIKERPMELTYLFSLGEQSFFLTNDRPTAGLEDYEMVTIQQMRQNEPKHLVFAGITAHHLYKWYEGNRYCGRCSNTMLRSKNERSLTCNKCGNILYPRISPAVIIGVVDGDRLLLIKHAGNYRGYALIAGFAEVGESIESTVVREVMEEVGLKVKNTRFYKSQPWALSESLLLGFYTELDGPQEVEVDGKEVAQATWFKRSEIPVEPNDFSLTNEMIIAFKSGKVL